MRVEHCFKSLEEMTDFEIQEHCEHLRTWQEAKKTNRSGLKADKKVETALRKQLSSLTEGQWAILKEML